MMQSAYDILQVAPSADDQAIKHAYLQAVRQYTPEQNPEMFQQVRDAYETIKTPRLRAKYNLLHEPEVNVYQLLERHIKNQPTKRPSAKQLLKALEESLKTQ